MKRMKNKLKTGFTLIELLVVIAIISMLATVVMSSMSKATKKGRDARRAADVKSLQNAIEMYATDNTGKYPSVDSESNMPDLVSDYIPKLPKDPINDSTYKYSYSVNSNVRLGYCINLRLEKDSSACHVKGGSGGSTCSGSECSF